MKIDLWREAITSGVLVALLAGAALADPWRQGEPGGPAAPRQMPTLPVRERHEPGAALGSPGGSFRPGTAESPLPRAAGAPRSPGVTRAVEARGEPIVLRLGFQRMAQVQFGAEIQQVITAFTKQQVSMETVGPRLFLSALEPDLSGELFVTLAGGTTLTLIIVPAMGMERDLVVRVVSPVAETAARDDGDRGADAPAPPAGHDPEHATARRESGSGRRPRRVRRRGASPHAPRHVDEPRT